MYKMILGIPVTVLFLMSFSTGAFADLAYIDPATNQSVLDQVVQKYQGKIKSWHQVIQGAAEGLFWSLVLISMVWKFGMMLLSKADIGDFFAEFTRFIIFTGFFFWLLTNAVTGHNIAGSIISSMEQLGNTAAGLPPGTSHSSIMDVGFLILSETWNNMNVMQPVDSFIGVILSLAILIILAVIAVNMLLLFISAWVLMYGGIFLLGFGGAAWTTDIAINYFKTVLSVGIQLFVMLLLVGIGSEMLTNFYGKMSQTIMNYEELSVMLIFVIAFFLLVSKVPPIVAGVITGSSIGSIGGVGSYSGGSIVAASAVAGMAAYAGGGAAISAASAGIDRTKSAASIVNSEPPGLGDISRTPKPDNSKPQTKSAFEGG